MKKNIFLLIIVLVIVVFVSIIFIPKVYELINRKVFEEESNKVLETLKKDYSNKLDNETAKEKKYMFPEDKLNGETKKIYGEALVDSYGNITLAFSDENKKWCAKKDSESKKITIEDYNEENCIINQKYTEKVTEKIEDGTLIYFDPEKKVQCNNYFEDNSTNENKNGCMKWYAFGGNNDSDKVNLLLDHNTTINIQNDKNQIDAKIKKDTSYWNKNLNPRLITIEEINKITGNNNFSNIWYYFDSNNQSQVANGTTKSKYSWLFDQTKGCINYGCDLEDTITSGYWVESKDKNNWYVHSSGNLNNTLVNNIGIRPVITVSKEIVF